MFGAKSVELPVEVWEQVIDLLQDDDELIPATLCSCTLTCRLWLPRSRLRLYEEVTLTQSWQVRPFSRALQTNPALAGLVRLLILYQGTFVFNFSGHPPLSNMHSLQLTTTGRSGPPDDKFFNRSFRLLPASLKSLELYTALRAYDLMQILSHFPNLEHLLCTMMVDKIHYIRHYPPSVCRLKRLLVNLAAVRMSVHSVDPCAQFVNYGLHGDAFRELRILYYQVFYDNHTLLNDLLKHCGPSLIYFEGDITTDDDIEYKSHFSLQQNTNMICLIIRLSQMTNSILRMFMAALSSITSTQMKWCVVEMSSNIPLSNYDPECWQHLDELLCHDSRFQSMQHCAIGCTYVDPLELAQLLPKLSKRGSVYDTEELHEMIQDAKDYCSALVGI